MNCPKCNGEIAASELTAPPRGAVAKAILTDWRTWVTAFVVMAISGLIAGALNLPSAGGVGGGAAIGVLIAVRMGRLRTCPKCAAIIDAPAS
jgi:hypothetical protein